MILRAKFNKKNYLKYISHLDLMRLFHRSFNRAGIPINYSEGFNPHPRFSIGSPLSVGLESEEEYMDIHMEEMEINDFINKMNEVLPKDIQILDADFLEKEESIAAIIAWSNYEISFETKEEIYKEELENKANKWLEKDEIIITKIGKKKKKRVEKEENIRPFIGNFIIKAVEGNNILVDTLLKTGSNGNLKPLDLINAFNRDILTNINEDTIRIKRIGLFAEKNDNIYKPL